MTFSILLGRSVLCEKTFRVVKGNSPSVSLIAPILSSGVLKKEGRGFLLESILSTASIEVVLIDQFLGPGDLLGLIDAIPEGTAIRLLTSLRLKSEYLRQKESIAGLPRRLTIKFSARFHDRYVIANGTEYFHFGYSLKDLWKGRISRFAKLYRKDEIDDLRAEYDGEWEIAEML